MSEQRDGKLSKYKEVATWIESLPIGTFIQIATVIEKYGIPPGTARSYFHRIVKDLGIIKRVADKDGNPYLGPGSALYERVAVDSTKESITQELEEALQESLQMGTMAGIGGSVAGTVAATVMGESHWKPSKKGTVKIEDYRVHNIEMALTKERMEALGVQRCNLNHMGVSPQSHKPQITPTMVMNLTIPWNIHSMLQTYSSPTMHYNERAKEYIDTIKWEDGRTVEIGIYQNGSVTVQIKCTDHDLDAGGIVAMNGFLQGVFPLKCGYSWNELSDLFIVHRIELNKDGNIFTIDRKFDPTTCWTFKDVHGTYARIYKREVKGREGIRTEVILEPQEPYSKFHGDVLALMQGGVTDYQVVQLFYALEKKIDALTNALKERKL